MTMLISERLGMRNDHKESYIKCIGAGLSIPFLFEKLYIEEAIWLAYVFKTQMYRKI